MAYFSRLIYLWLNFNNQPANCERSHIIVEYWHIPKWLRSIQLGDVYDKLPIVGLRCLRICFMTEMVVVKLLFWVSFPQVLQYIAVLSYLVTSRFLEVYLRTKKNPDSQFPPKKKRGYVNLGPSTPTQRLMAQPLRSPGDWKWTPRKGGTKRLDGRGCSILPGDLGGDFRRHGNMILFRNPHRWYIYIYTYMK